jgi:hypothetical protein
MAEWQYNEVGRTYNEVGLRYNFLAAVAGAAKNLYAGGIAAAKRLTRGLGF